MPLGAIDVGPGLGLGHGELGVERQGGVIVHVAGGVVHHTAVAVVGELVEAAVGHHHHRVAHGIAHRGQGPLGDPVGPEGGGAGGVLVLGPGQPEQDHPGHAQRAQPLDLDGQRVHGVLHHAGQRRDRARLVEAVGHEQRGHQVVDGQSGLGDQPAQGRLPPQTAQAGGREPGHGRAGPAGGGVARHCGTSLRQVGRPGAAGGGAAGQGLDHGLHQPADGVRAGLGGHLQAGLPGPCPR